MFIFQSTPPVKAATFIQIYDRLITMISIHAAREGGDSPASATVVPNSISIHAAREGGDLTDMIRNPHFGHFNPRRP